LLRREGRYLLRTNLTDTDPVELWNYYLQLVQVEEAFRTLKSDLAIRPIFHQRMENIEAHVFVAFLSYCLYVTLGRQLKALAPGSPRAVRSRNLPPCRWSMCVSRPPTHVRFCSLDTRSRSLNWSFCSSACASRCLPNRRRKSAPLRSPPPPSCSADLWGCTLGASIT
jgi:hypothetical protein